ncbi:MAG: UbiA family prenyltransferase [Bacteroidia bacterium]|nr:UbiA family prenyltransferase [Bacteroidia bacterium]
MKIFNFIINTNIYISLAAVALTLGTQVQLGMQPQLHPYLFIIFFATIFEYNLHRLITIITNPASLNNEKHSWVKNNKIAFYVLVSASVVGFSIAVALAKKIVLITLFPIGVVTLFYSLPVFKTKKIIFRLREIPCLKIFLISMVWAATTILLPIIQCGQTFGKWHVINMLIERFIFVFAITIPFDIRDMKSDEQTGLQTIPLIIGEKKALLVGNVYMVLFLVVCCFHYYKTSLAFILPAFIISAFTTLLFLNSKKIKSLTHYHYFILDGTMLLQGFLICVCYYFTTINN